MVGRPSSYTQQAGDYICAEIARGRSLRNICETEPEMPAFETVRRWILSFPAFREQYARAREVQCDTLADEALDSAREATPENANAVRVKLDAIKWFAGKVHPKVYGDATLVKHAGHDGGELSVNLTSAQKLQRVANLTKKLGVVRAAQDVEFEEVDGAPKSAP